MPGNTPPDRQPHLSVPLPLPLSRRLLLSLRCLAGDVFFFFLDHVCLGWMVARKKEKKKKGAKTILERRGREKLLPKSVSICICLGVFVCVAVSAVVLQVQSRCLSFFCSSPASINRSLCALQLLRGFVLFSLFFFFFSSCSFSSPASPLVLRLCLSVFTFIKPPN